MAGISKAADEARSLLQSEWNLENREFENNSTFLPAEQIV